MLLVGKGREGNMRMVIENVIGIDNPIKSFPFVWWLMSLQEDR